MARRLVGGTPGGLFDGKLAPEQVFAYPGQRYVLWVASKNGSPPQVLLAKQGGPLLAELTARSFDDSGFPSGERPSVHLQALVNAATALVRASRPSATPRPTVAALRSLQQAVTAAGDRVVADIQANACKVLNAGCFAAGTKL